MKDEKEDNDREWLVEQVRQRIDFRDVQIPERVNVWRRSFKKACNSTGGECKKPKYVA